MAIKRIPRWLVITLCIWVVIEVTHQLYLRAAYVSNGDYDWERYAVERNMDKLLQIKEYFSRSDSSHFDFQRNPDEGSLSSLPDSIQLAIEGLSRDLLSGCDLLGSRQNFSIVSNVSSKGMYSIDVDAGGVFKQSYNGYNFSLTITNKGNPSDTYGQYAAVGDSTFYVERMWNRQYRSTPIILHYNCNSYDLLVKKLWRWMM